MHRLRCSQPKLRLCDALLRRGSSCESFLISSVHNHNGTRVDFNQCRHYSFIPPPAPPPSATSGGEPTASASPSSSSSPAASSKQTSFSFVPPPAEAPETRRFAYLATDTASSLNARFSSLKPPTDLESFCFLVDLAQIPPPPSEAHFHVTKETLAADSAVDDSEVFAIQNFVGTVPSYFIPVDELLQKLEGYTMDHIRMYFSKAKGVQIVSIANRQYIRLHGGHAGFDMTDTVEAEKMWPQYKIDPSLAKPFIQAFGGIRNRWMPLRLLLEKGGRANEAKLPFQGPAALLYFAQLQHIFAFAPDNGGAVQLREDGYDQLCLDTSPCPAPMSMILDQTVEERYEVSHVISEFINDDQKMCILQYFTSVEEAIRRHRKVLWLEEDTGMMMRTRVRERLERKKLPLEQQLEIALRENIDKKKIRLLRKRIQIKNNPDNPLLDRDNTAREIFNFIPKKGFISLSLLVRQTLPPHLLDFMGTDHLRFFRGFPQYFQVFEYREATKWCISRPGIPLPRGVLRTDYTEEEAIRIAAAVIQRRGAMPIARMSLYLPEGCRSLIKTKFVNVYNLLAKYPQYFSIMKRSGTRNCEGSSIVSLLAMPLEGAGVENDVGGFRRQKGALSPASTSGGGNSEDGDNEGGIGVGGDDDEPTPYGRDGEYDPVE